MNKPRTLSTCTDAELTAIAFAQNQLGELRTSDTVGTLGTNANASGRATPMVATADGETVWDVRRLTPTECERLMKWPDVYTRYGLFPQRGKRRHKYAIGIDAVIDGITYNTLEIADGPRYKMIGNGVGEPVARWVAERMMSVAQASHTTAPDGQGA